nr:HNH endonuclease signature motif containing protein [Chromobacterium haemolyticum]
MCQARGMVEPATVVDHIEPHQGDQAKFWDKTNWQALCTPCHSSEKQRQERRST